MIRPGQFLALATGADSYNWYCIYFTLDRPSLCLDPVTKGLITQLSTFFVVHTGKSLPTNRGMVRMSELGTELCGSGDIYCLCGRVMCRASLRNKSASLFRSHRIKFHVLKNGQCRSDLESSMRRPVRHPGNAAVGPRTSLAGFGISHRLCPAHLMVMGVLSQTNLCGLWSTHRAMTPFSWAVIVRGSPVRQV